MDATRTSTPLLLPRLLVLATALLHIATASFPISKKYDDSNPEGVPGVDYPIYRSVPRGLPFSCYNRKPGFYADPDTDCQVWHICDLHGRRYSFLCANKTVFNQENRGCDWWYNVNCDASEDLYSNNDDVFKSNRIGVSANAHPISFEPRPPHNLRPNRVNLDLPSANRLDIPKESRPPHVVTARPPPPPPTPGPAVPARTKTPRPLVPLDLGKPVTFKVIRRPVTTTPPPSFDINEEPVRPVRPRPALGPFRSPPPPPPPPVQSSNNVPFSPAGQPFTEGPPSSWTVHFIAGNVKPDGQPPFVDQSWRIADQERAFPTESHVSAQPPNDIASFPTTRRAPHGFSTVPPVDQDFIPPRRTRLPPPSTQRPTEFATDFPPESSTARFIPPIAVSTQSPFGSRSTLDWFTSTPVPFTDNNAVKPQNDNTFVPARQEESLLNDFDEAHRVFGNRGSQVFEPSDDNIQNPSTAEPLHSSRFPSIRPVEVTTNRFFASSSQVPDQGQSEPWRNNPVDESSPASLNQDTWWSTPQQENVQNDNLLSQTEPVHIPPELPAELGPNSFVAEEQDITTKWPENNIRITTYHPQRLASDLSSAFQDQNDVTPSTTQHPVVRTTRRRVAKTTTPPSTPKPTTTTTTQRPSPRPKAVVLSDDSSIAEEPSIPLAFGTRLVPKKTYRIDNEGSSSDIDPSTIKSDNDRAKIETGPSYQLPPIVDDKPQAPSEELSTSN